MPPQLVSSFAKGAINVHPSDLPRYALLDGARATAVSVIDVHPERFDAGRVFARREVAVAGDDSFTSLSARCAEIGADLMEGCLADWDAAAAAATPQEGPPTLAPKITREQGRLMWRDPAPGGGESDREWRRRGVFGSRLRAPSIARRVRALEQDVRVCTGVARVGKGEAEADVHLTRVREREEGEVPQGVREACREQRAVAGTLFPSRSPPGLFVLCEGGTWLEVEEGQVVGKAKRVSGPALANGRRMGAGTHWCVPPA